MIRKIIHMNEEICNGCGLCASACHEGAIGMVDGKAKLLRDDYCCGGIEHAAVEALKSSGKFLPWQVITISTDGRILD